MSIESIEDKAPVRLTGHYDGLGLTELCRVEAVDDPGPGGAHHHYELWRDLVPAEARALCLESADLLLGEIQFQRGPRGMKDSTPGTLDGAVLSVLIHRLECFQAGPFACPENQEALDHLLAARRAIIGRALKRAARGVLGTMKP